MNQIKLNIWGIRGGFRSFCHSEDLNVEEPEIKNTWKDIRDFVYVSDLSVRFYALEFTPTYKVYTLYRPVNDTSRTGAFVAVTLYVPHGYRVNQLVNLLKQISDAYHKDHYDAFGNPNSNPDYVPVYMDILNNYASHVMQESKKRVWSASTQDNTPKIFPYSDVSVLEAFFAEPYRKEFLVCQEVMFWNINLLQNLQTYGVKFQKSDSLNDENCFHLNGEGIKEQFKGGQIKNQPLGCEVVQFICNGEDITKSWTSAFFEDQDEIVIQLRKPFHDAKLFHGAMAGAGSVFVKYGSVDYEFGRINMNPRRYSTPIVVPAELARKGFDIYVDNIPVSIDGGQGVMSFYGNELDAVRKFSLRCGGASFPVMEMRLKDLMASGNDENVAPIKVSNLKLVKFEFNHPCKGRVFINKQEIGINTGSGTYFDFVLPADVKLDVEALVFDIEDTKVKVESKDPTTFKLSLTSSVFYVGIGGLEELQGYADYNCFKLKLNGETYTSLPGFKFKLPQELKEAVKKSEGELSVMADGNQTVLCSYDLAQGIGVCEFILAAKWALFNNETETTVTLSSEKVKSIVVSPRKKVILPLIKWNAMPNNRDKDSYEVVGDSYGGTWSFAIRKRISQTGGKNENTIKRESPCYYIEDQCFVLNGNPVSIKDYLCYTISNLRPGRQVKLCFHMDKTPYPDMTERTCAKQNSENGFKVSLNNEGAYVVSDLKKKTGKVSSGKVSGPDRGDSGKKGKWAIMGAVMAVLVLAVVGLLIWKPWGSKKADYVIKIKMEHRTMIQSVELKLSPKSDLAKIEPRKDSVALIDLFDGWKKLSLIVKTNGEGNCEKIDMQEQGKGKENHSTPKLLTPIDDKKVGNDTLIIVLKSPAWSEFEKVREVKGYADLAKRYPDSPSLIKACVDKAYEFANNDTVAINDFLEGFGEIREAKKKVQELSMKMDLLRQEVKEAEAAENLKKESINTFTTKLKTVYSINCTKKAVGELREAYAEVKDYNRKDLDESMRASGLKPLDDPAFNVFLEKQDEFFTIFNKNFSKAQSMVTSYLGTYTAKFSSDQRTYMKILVQNEEIFDYFKDHINECNDGKFYKFIKDHLEEMKRSLGISQIDSSDESEAQTQKAKKVVIK